MEKLEVTHVVNQQLKTAVDYRTYRLADTSVECDR